MVHQSSGSSCRDIISEGPALSVPIDPTVPANCDRQTAAEVGLVMSNSFARKALSKTVRRSTRALSASTIENTSKAVQLCFWAYPLSFLRALPSRKEWSLGWGLQMCLGQRWVSEAEPGGRSLPNSFPRMSWKWQRFLQVLQMQRSFSTNCCSRLTRLSVWVRLQSCTSAPAKLQMYAHSSSASLRLLAWLSSLICSRVLRFLPLALARASFFLRMSKRQSYLAMAQLSLYWLKERARVANPKTKKATSPPMMPQVSQNLSPRTVWRWTRCELSKVRLQQQCLPYSATSEVSFCRKRLTIQVSLNSPGRLPSCPSSSISIFERETLCWTGQLTLKGSIARLMISYSTVPLVASALAEEKWYTGRYSCMKCRTLELLTPLRSNTDTTKLWWNSSYGSPSSSSSSPSGTQQPRCESLQYIGSTRVLSQEVKQSLLQGNISCSVRVSTLLPLVRWLVRLKRETPSPLAIQVEMSWGQSWQAVEKVTPSLKLEPVVSRMWLLWSPLSSASVGCIISQAMPCFSSSRSRQTLTSKLAMMQMNISRMRKQQPPQTDVASRLPLMVRLDWYSKMSKKDQNFFYGCPEQWLSLSRSLFLANSAASSMIFSSKSCIAPIFSSISPSAPVDSFSTRRLSPADGLFLLEKKVSWVPQSTVSSKSSASTSSTRCASGLTSIASSTFSFTNTMLRYRSWIRLKSEVLSRKQLSVALTSQRQLSTLFIFLSTCRTRMMSFLSPAQQKRQVGMGSRARNLRMGFSSTLSSSQRSLASWPRMLQWLQPLAKQWKMAYQKTKTPPIMARRESALRVSCTYSTCMEEGLMSTWQQGELVGMLRLRGWGVLGLTAMPSSLTLAPVRMNQLVVSSICTALSTKTVSSQAVPSFMNRSFMCKSWGTRLLMSLSALGSYLFQGSISSTSVLFMKTRKSSMSSSALAWQKAGVEAQQGWITNPKQWSLLIVISRCRSIVQQYRSSHTSLFSSSMSNSGQSLAVISTASNSSLFPLELSMKNLISAYLSLPAKAHLWLEHTAMLRLEPVLQV